MKKTDVDPVNTYDAIDGKLSFQGMAITSLVNVVLVSLSMAITTLVNVVLVSLSMVITTLVNVVLVSLS